LQRSSPEKQIPSSTTATLYIPTTDVNTVTEGGQPVAQAKGVVFRKMEAGAAVYEVGAGNYQFSSTMPKTIR
jgi:alpha-L-rhamnosidase